MIIGWYALLIFSLTASGMALVQNWIANPSSNYGIIIADPSTGDGADFHSMIIGWFALLIFSYKGAEILLKKSGRL